MAIKLKDYRLAEAKGADAVRKVVKDGIAAAAKISGPVKYVAANKYKVAGKEISLFLVVDNPAEFLTHIKQQKTAAFANGTALVTPVAGNNHKISIQEAHGTLSDQNKVAALVKTAANDMSLVTTSKEEEAKVVNFQQVFYPQSGELKVAAVRNVEAEFRRAMGSYLQGVLKLSAEDVRDIVLENVAEAQAMVNRAKTAANHDELVVRGGLLPNGDLVLAVVGPGSGAVAAPVVLRANFEKKVIGRLQNPKNAVVNLEPDKLTHQGDLKPDAVIAQAAQRQAKKFGVDIQKTTDDINVGGIKVGTIVLAAHGDKIDIAKGLVMGTKLGEQTPQQIVELLTRNADENKRLSPKFRGTILLSGCFTGAGKGGVIPAGYDYSIFAKQVYLLLLKAGYHDFRVQGMPGPSYTDEHGNKEVLPAAVDQKLDRVKKKKDTAQLQALDEFSKMQAAEAEAVAIETRRQELAEELETQRTEFDDVAQEIQGAEVELQQMDSELAELDAELKVAETETYPNPRVRDSALRAISSNQTAKQEEKDQLNARVKSWQEKQADLIAEMQRLKAEDDRQGVELEKVLETVRQADADSTMWFAEFKKQSDKHDQLMRTIKLIPNLVTTFGRRKI